MTIFYENLNEALTNAKKEYLKNCDYYEPPKSFHVKHLVQVANNRAVNRKWAVFFSNTDTILNDFRTFLLNTLNQTEKGDIEFLEANVLHAWQDEWNEWEDEDGYYHNQWELPAEKKNYVNL